MLHAVAAAIVLVAAVWQNFWHNFLHGGFAQPPPTSTLLLLIGFQAMLFGSLLLVLWVSTLFVKSPADDGNNAPKAPKVLKALKFTVLAFVPIILAAFALEWISTELLQKVFSIEPAGQDLVKWLQPGTYPLSIRIMLMAFALFEAPLLEEPLFRGIMFRGFARSMPSWVAMVVSGFVFALIHVNAATMMPLWFLGIAFAWLYQRTGTILAPIAAHFLFNLVNLVLVMSGLVG